MKTLVSMPTSRRQPLVRPPADARVLALGVLAHEEHVHVAGPASGKRARDPLQQPGRAQVRPQVEPLAQLEEQPPERDVVGDGRVADRAHQHGTASVQRLAPVGRHHPAVLVPVGRAPRELRPLELEAERVDRPPRLRHHLRPDPVAGEERDPVVTRRRRPSRARPRRTRGLRRAGRRRRTWR